MAFRWTALAIPSLAALLLGWSLAWIVYRTRPDRKANRLLALVLAIGSSLFFAYSGLRLLTDTPEEAYGAVALFTILNLLVPPLYGAFLSTLDTPMVAFLRRPTVRAALLAYSFVGIGIWIARPDAFLTGFSPMEAFAAFGALRGPLWIPLLNVVPVLVLLFALAASISAYRRASTEAGRMSAKWTMISFGVRDALTVAIIVIGAAMPHHPAGEFAPFLGFPIVDAIHVSLLAYAILRSQLFDIDLRMQRALRAGTVGTFFIAAFFIAAEVAQSVLNERLGMIAGGAAAGVLLFALRPLERAAERFAHAAVPAAPPTSEYATFRKCEVYREAAAEILASGSIGERDRAVLTRLARAMDLSPETATAIERDLAPAPGLTSP